MVGSRKCTHYGLSVADRLSYQLAQTGFTVVSGLARGIDTAAHEGTLKAKGRTIAVLGSAIDQLYPPENAELADAIARSGAVISEYPFGRQADRMTFPYRNRIISGISMGIIVVESGAKSGSLHTADAATEQGRSVFAVPGRIDSPASKGTNRLIKNGAKLVDNVGDILEEFELLIPQGNLEEPQKETSARPDVPLSEPEKRVVEALWQEAKDVDTLVREIGINSAQMSGLLLGLEMKRVIRMLPGRMVELADDLRG
jgi:DNA processing protein